MEAWREEQNRVDLRQVQRIRLEGKGTELNELYEKFAVRQGYIDLCMGGIKEAKVTRENVDGVLICLPTDITNIISDYATGPAWMTYSPTWRSMWTTQTLTGAVFRSTTLATLRHFAPTCKVTAWIGTDKPVTIYLSTYTADDGQLTH